MKYAKCGRGKTKHLFAADERYDAEGVLLPHEFLGGDETRCGSTATGVWTDDEAMTREYCDRCFASRGLSSRANSRRHAFLKDNPDAYSRFR